MSAKHRSKGQPNKAKPAAPEKTRGGDGANERTQQMPGAGEDRLAQQIGRRLVQAREGLGLSQQAVATRSNWNDPTAPGISRSTLSLYETGVNRPGAREIVMLCEVLKVTPNWLLYGSESPAQALQASRDLLRGDDLEMSVALSFAILALAPEEREAHKTLVLALASEKLGDLHFASLLMLARGMRDKLLDTIVDTVGEENRHLPIRELAKLFIEKGAQGFTTVFGTLRPAVQDEDYDPFEDGVPPPRRLGEE